MPREIRQRHVSTDCDPPPRITTPMVALAFSVVNSPDDAPQCGRILAEMILEVAEGKPR